MNLFALLCFSLLATLIRCQFSFLPLFIYLSIYLTKLMHEDHGPTVEVCVCLSAITTMLLPSERNASKNGYLFETECSRKELVRSEIGSSDLHSRDNTIFQGWDH